MRVLVYGGRYYNDAPRLYQVLDEFHAATPITILIEGEATGADMLKAHQYLQCRTATESGTNLCASNITYLPR